MAGPHLERLSRQIDHLEDRHSELVHQLEVRAEWLSSHPEAARRMALLDWNLAQLERELSPSVADDFTDLLARRLAPFPGRTLERDLGLDAGIDFGP